MPESHVAVACEAAPAEFRAQDRAARPNLLAFLPIFLSVTLLIAVAIQLPALDMPRLYAQFPVLPAFWLAFVAFYLAGPLSEWLIFRRLWAIPRSGFAALLRKLVYNELVLGYLGEASFYAWARRKAPIAAAPFGTVKDVAILSALAGNGVTLLLLVALWPLVGSTRIGIESETFVWSLGVVLAISIALMAMRKRVFSLERHQLSFILKMHLARIFVTTALSALLWHLVLPQIPLLIWLYLAMVRLLISRLPLVPNKDVIFAGFAVLAIGDSEGIASLLTMMAGILLAVHLAVATVLAGAELARVGDRA